MKTCPSCAEQIQDAASICKHCGRKVPSGAALSTAGRGKLRALRGVLGGVLIAAVAIALRSQGELRAQADHAALMHQDSLRAMEGVRVADSIAAATPQIVAIADSAALTIPAGQFYAAKFDTPNNDRNCVVQGKVIGLTGANKDVAVMLFTDDQYADWRADVAHRHSSWPIEKAQTINIAHQLYGRGTYYLVVSNDFSLVSEKIVQLHVRLRCTTDARPAIRE